MSGRGRLSGAIRRVGVTAWLVRGEERLPFTASIQPSIREAEDEHTPIGYGTPARYTIYAGPGGNAAKIQAGDIVAWEDNAYQVGDIETVYLSGKAVYRKGHLRKRQGTRGDG